jgi:hypothetical protein
MHSERWIELLDLSLGQVPIGEDPEMTHALGFRRYIVGSFVKNCTTLGIQGEVTRDNVKRERPRRNWIGP